VCCDVCIKQCSALRLGKVLTQVTGRSWGAEGRLSKDCQPGQRKDGAGPGLVGSRRSSTPGRPWPDQCLCVSPPRSSPPRTKQRHADRSAAGLLRRTCSTRGKSMASRSGDRLLLGSRRPSSRRPPSPALRLVYSSVFSCMLPSDMLPSDLRAAVCQGKRAVSWRSNRAARDCSAVLVQICFWRSCMCLCSARSQTLKKLPLSPGLLLCSLQASGGLPL